MDLDEIIIEEVKKHNCLFDLSSENYKNVVGKDKLWENIGKNLNLDGTICRKKWKVLRDTYRRIKRSETSSGSGASQRKRWRHYDSMTFLDGVQTSRRTTTNFVGDEIRCDSPPLFEQNENGFNLSPGLSTLPAAITPSPLKPSRSGLKYTQVQENFSGFLNIMADSAQQLAASIGQKKQESPTEAVFNGLAKVLDGANMPDEEIERVLELVRMEVFTAIHNWKTRKQ